MYNRASMQCPKERLTICAVLFDLDGVLINSFTSWYHLFNRTLRHFGYEPITQQVFSAHWGQSTDEDVRIFMPRQKVDEVKQFFSNHYKEYIQFITLNPSAHEVLKKIKVLNLKLGCVTNSHRDIVEEILRTKHIQPFFQAVITADDVTEPKPAPEMLLKACVQLQAAPAHTVFCGDTPTDMQAGKDAGCIVIGYETPGTIQVNSLNDVYQFLRAHV